MLEVVWSEDVVVVHRGGRIICHEDALVVGRFPWDECLKKKTKGLNIWMAGVERWKLVVSLAQCQIAASTCWQMSL